jgi:hypothetical protein
MQRFYPRSQRKHGFVRWNWPVWRKDERKTALKDAWTTGKGMWHAKLTTECCCCRFAFPRAMHPARLAGSQSQLVVVMQRVDVLPSGSPGDFRQRGQPESLLACVGAAGDVDVLRSACRPMRRPRARCFWKSFLATDSQPLSQLGFRRRRLLVSRSPRAQTHTICYQAPAFIHTHPPANRTTSQNRVLQYSILGTK